MNGSKASRGTGNTKRKKKKIELPYYNCVLKDTNFRDLNAAYASSKITVNNTKKDKRVVNISSWLTN